MVGISPIRSTEQTMRDYIQKIVVPYIEKMRQTSRLADNYHALLLFDNFKAQCTQELLTLLDDNFINVLQTVQIGSSPWISV